MVAARAAAVTFDVGQVLLRFEPSALSRKLAAMGIEADVARIDEAQREGWAAWGAAHRAGTAREAWFAFVGTLIERATGRAAGEALLSWLFDDNGRDNLWRRPVPGMIEVARALGREGVPVGIVSNSEGGLEKLLGEVGYRDDFRVIADSARVGFEKPDARLFWWVYERLGVEARTVVHIGDSWAADVEGAIAAGSRAVWFPAVDERAEGRVDVLAAQSVIDVQRALVAFGLPERAVGL